MTPGDFIAKWRASELKERSAAQEHFIDLCRLLGEPTPAEADPTGERYCFERGARKDTGGDGWADVWKRHCFAWEYKGRHADLDVAFNQLRQYALALENPPLLNGQAERRLRAFLERLRQFTVLDPACGSGNFLHLALHALKDLEHRVQVAGPPPGTWPEGVHRHRVCHGLAMIPRPSPH